MTSIPPAISRRRNLYRRRWYQKKRGLKQEPLTYARGEMSKSQRASLSARQRNLKSKARARRHETLLWRLRHHFTKIEFVEYESLPEALRAQIRPFTGEYIYNGHLLYPVDNPFTPENLPYTTGNGEVRT